MSKLIIFLSDSDSVIQVQLEDEMSWLMQKQEAYVFRGGSPVISKHLTRGFSNMLAGIY